MKQIGIWIDKRFAYIISGITEKDQQVVRIESNVEDYHVGGGSGTRFKGGPQDVVQDSKYLEREKKQLKDYFKIVIQELMGEDSILIFGPAETGQKLQKLLFQEFPEIEGKVESLSKADSMTVNQMKAWVRDFYSH
ncbi:MAG: hypothetical protein K0U54_04470 [Bacteroidetes bacterium]|nr:hypothetical protein [Bacteroidota bacterium]